MASPGQLQRARRSRNLFAVSLAGDAADRARAAAEAAARAQALAAELSGSTSGSSSFGGLGAAGAAGIGLLGAGLGATAGLSLATLGSEAGFILTQPELALPGAVLLGLELSGVLQGKPKLEDTVQAAQRLMASPFEPLRLLGQRLAIFARNGVPLSTSNPKLQGQIRSAIRGTVQTILSQYPLAGTADQIDTALNAALTSQHGSAALAQLQQRLTRSALLTPQPQSAATQLPRLNPATFYPMPGPPGPVGVPMLGQGGAVMSGPTTIPSEIRSLISRLQQSSDASTFTEVVGCVALAAIEPAFAAKCLEALAVKVVAQGAKTIVQSIAQFFRNQISGGGPGPAPAPQPSSYPGPAPILDQQKPCPECERGLSAKQRAQLQQERDALRQEQQTEQGQLTQQQLDQIQTQIERLKASEQTQQSDQQITQSLQEKQDLLNQLTQIQQGQGGGGQPVVSTPTTVPAPMLQQNDAAQQIEQELEHAHEAHGVQFCVGCQTNEDAILFLNGEPSKCSVVPGTTKELNVNG